MLSGPQSLPPDPLSEAEQILSAARVKMNDANRATADHKIRERSLIERHALLVKEATRIREFEAQLTAWEADLKQRETIIGGEAK